MPFWLHFEPRGVPGDPLEPLCVAPVPQDPPKCDLGVILDPPWDNFWPPVGVILRLWTRSGGPWGAFWHHFWSIWLPLGFDMIFGHDQTLQFLRVADVAEVY